MHALLWVCCHKVVLMCLCINYVCVHICMYACSKTINKEPFKLQKSNGRICFVKTCTSQHRNNLQRCPWFFQLIRSTKRFISYAFSILLDKRICTKSIASVVVCIDKQPYCSSIYPGSCYNYTVMSNCCSTCSRYLGSK